MLHETYEEAKQKIAEQYLGLALQMEYKSRALCLEEVAELQNFCTERRRNWKLKADVVNERWVIVSRAMMLAPHPPQVFFEHGKMYSMILINEGMGIKKIMEDKLNGVLKEPETHN